MNNPGELIVRVPVTTSNLGPGFDTLGLALNLFNDFTVRVRTDEGPNALTGRGACEGLSSKKNPFFTAVERIQDLVGRPVPALEVIADGAVPIGVGLGTSAAAATAGALAANALLGSPLGQEELIGPLVEIDGHPDNVAPSLLGGLTLALQTDKGPLVHVYEPHADWRLALLIPDYSISTAEARKALPRKVAREDALFNLARLPVLIDALVAGDAVELALALDDRLHQPYRRKKIKRYKKICRAATEAGAAATFISGSGPAIGAFCLGEAAAGDVANAMTAAVKTAKFTATAMTLRPTPHGARLAEGE